MKNKRKENVFYMDKEIAEKDQFDNLEKILLKKRIELVEKKENERLINLDELLGIYSELKRIAKDKYYPQIQTLFSWYTDHGQKHVESIIRKLGELLGQSYGRLNEMEIFILLCACIFHDTGMTISRNEHADKAIEIIKSMRDVISDITVTRQINEIARAHSSQKDLSELKPMDSCTFKDITYSVQTRALAAMLRLADDISETKYRIIPELLEEVPEDNAIYWYYASVVESVKISPADMTCKIKLCIPQSILLKEFKYGRIQNKIFFEYVLERIEKSYKERIMCSIEFRNIVIISSFEIEMYIMTDDLIDEIENLKFEIDERYCQPLGLKEAFYKKNPMWTIDELKKKYT